jgi:hypothetical protein
VNHSLVAEPDQAELLKVMSNRKCGSAPGGDGKFVDFYKAMCAPLEGGSGRGLTKLLEVVVYIWGCEKVEESWLVGRLRLLPKSGDLSNPNNWRGITLLAVIGKIFCSVLSNRITSHMQVIGLEAQCGFMPGKSTVDAIYTMRVSLQKRFKLCTLAALPLSLCRFQVVLHSARIPHPCSCDAQSKCMGLRYGASAGRVQNASRAQSVPCQL